MAKTTTQIGPRLSEEALAILAALQRFYAQRAGLLQPVSQSQALEIVLRDAAQREAGLKLKGRK